MIVSTVRWIPSYVLDSYEVNSSFFYILLTLFLDITLIGDQLEAQLFYIIRLFQSCTCFEQTRAHHQEVNLLIQHLV